VYNTFLAHIQEQHKRGIIKLLDSAAAAEVALVAAESRLELDVEPLPHSSMTAESATATAGTVGSWRSSDEHDWEEREGMLIAVQCYYEQFSTVDSFSKSQLLPLLSCLIEHTEDCLYRTADSRATYADAATLHSRLRTVAEQFRDVCESAWLQKGRGVKRSATAAPVATAAAAASAAAAAAAPAAVQARPRSVRAASLAATAAIAGGSTVVAAAAAAAAAAVVPARSQPSRERQSGVSRRAAASADAASSSSSSRAGYQRSTHSFYADTCAHGDVQAAVGTGTEQQPDASTATTSAVDQHDDDCSGDANGGADSDISEDIPIYEVDDWEGGDVDGDVDTDVIMTDADANTDTALPQSPEQQADSSEHSAAVTTGSTTAAASTAATMAAAASSSAVAAGIVTDATASTTLATASSLAVNAVSAASASAQPIVHRLLAAPAGTWQCSASIGLNYQNSRRCDLYACIVALSMCCSPTHSPVPHSFHQTA
jgi:hypothetical protein